MLLNNILCVTEPMNADVGELSDVGRQFRDVYGFGENKQAIDTPEVFSCKLQSCNVEVPIWHCFAYRPIQEIIHAEPIAPLSGVGPGWDSSEGEQWFSRNPPEKRRRAATDREISKDRLITRTMTHIRFSVGSLGEKLYEFRCGDMNQFVEKNTSLKMQHKKLLQKGVFECSQDFVMSLPFNDVKKWRINNWIPLKHYVAPLRKHIAEMEKSDITNVQLWRKNSLNDVCIFRTQLDTIATGGSKSSKVIFIKATEILKDFS